MSYSFPDTPRETSIMPSAVIVCVWFLLALLMQAVVVRDVARLDEVYIPYSLSLPRMRA